MARSRESVLRACDLLGLAQQRIGDLQRRRHGDQQYWLRNTRNRIRRASPGGKASRGPMIGKTGGPVLKLTFCLRRLSPLSLAEFQDYWLNRHGPLVRRLQPALGMVRYVQVHRGMDTLADGARA